MNQHTLTRRMTFAGTVVLAVHWFLAPCSAQQVSAQAIPPSAFAVIDVQPKSALAQPSFELVPHEIIKVFGEKELGINLLELKRVTAIIDKITDPSMEQPPEFGVRIEFDSPQTLSDKILGELKPMTFGDKTAYSLGNDDGILVIRDEKTMFLGMEPFLKKMLEAADSSGPLQQTLNGLPSEDHLKIVVVLDPIRDTLKENLPAKNEVPPPFGEFIVLPDLIDSISYRANFSTNDVSELTIEAIDEKAAKKIVRLINNAVEWGKGAALTGVASEMDMSDPDYEAAVVAYSDRLSEWLKLKLRPTVDGKKLVYDLREAGGGGTTSVATIGILTGLLLPAVQQAREAARRASSQNTLKQLALAAMNYESAYGKFPLQANYDNEGKALLSWRVHLLPFLEQNALYDQFKLDESWDSPHNIALLEQMPAIFKNPNFESDTETIYLAVAGPGTVFSGNKKIGFADITDGSSNTAMFLEANPEVAVEWTKPADWELFPIDPLQGLGGLRNGGFNVVFCDGSVHFLDLYIDPEVWKNITQIADGNVIDPWELGQ